MDILIGESYVNREISPFGGLADPYRIPEVLRGDADISFKITAEMKFIGET